MLKKMLIWGGLTVAGLAVVNSAWRGSVHTGWKHIKAQAQKAVSPEFELDRLRDQIAQLTPDMHKNIHKIAEEVVAVEGLERKCKAIQTALDEQKKGMESVMAQFEAGAQRVRLTSGREVGAAEAKRRLEADFRSYKTNEKDLLSKQKQLEYKKEGLDAAKQQLAEIRAQKVELENLLAEYEADLANVRLAQTKSKVKLNDSRLAEIKASFERLRERLDVEKTAAQLSGQFLGDAAPAAEAKADGKDVTTEVREYFKSQDRQASHD